MDSLFSLLTDVTVDGFALWIVLLICVGVFLGSFMDAIAGGGGIITVPTYLIAFSRLLRPGHQQALLRNRHGLFHRPLH